jgi:hypothetical protein
MTMNNKIKAVKDKVVLITLCCLMVSFGTKAQIKLHLLEETQEACIGPGMAGTEDNKFGCEGGIVIKEQGIYHCFTTEVWGSPKLSKTRLAQWTSSDGVHFTRIGTIVKPELDTTSNVYYREPWTPYPIYNEKENRWNLFFTGYGIGSRIVRAVSKTPGRKGLNGPWENKEIVIGEQPKKNRLPDAPSDGNSFFPYQVGEKWLAFYGFSNYSPKTTRNDWKFQVALAESKSLNGPWKMVNNGKPVLMDDRFVENPVVHRLAPNKYIALYDGETTHGIAYAVSNDGLNWGREKALWLTSPPTPWAWAMRTPLGLVHEHDDVYALYYTAFDYSEKEPREKPIYHNGFGRVGRLLVRVEME